ncbi:MAG: GIY-YIG nuclease family protein [Parcubacteria group bacterium]|nr:GIY-YIG nuclease family protein [Parcubacteria group bacterium]
MSLSTLREKIKSLPQTPGVYLFKDNRGTPLYVGKASHLKNRVNSYFLGKDTRGEKIAAMLSQVSDIEVIETDSALEAVILEANLIKKYQPKYNVKEKDNRSFCYAVITREEFPRVLIYRERELDSQKISPASIAYKFGPFPSRRELEICLKAIRRIFPYHSRQEESEKHCLDYQLGRCPGPFGGRITLGEYRRNIQGIRLLLAGKKRQLIPRLEKEMLKASNGLNFVKAERLKKTLNALKFIQDIALIRADALLGSHSGLRIECYDISDISGAYTVGSMAVFRDGQSDRSQYRKFRVKTIKGINDIGAMREVLTRRLRHSEWPRPDLIILDGGQGHLNMGKSALSELSLNIPIAAAAKGPARKKLDIYGSEDIADPKILEVLKNDKLIRQIRDEAHRFAIKYHRILRDKI